MRARAARHLGAFKKAVHTLKEYYRGLPDTLQPSHLPQLFPHHTHFTSLEDNREQCFEYVSQPFDETLIFFGELSNGQRVCIKFVRKYSKDAHLCCAALGCAPTLYGFETLPGGWFMVVMDAIGDDYVKLCDTNPTRSALERVRECLVRLHRENYVHGDVRSSNIVVCQSDMNKVIVLDFDWAGKIGEVKYPMNVNRAWDLWRPEGAVDGGLITAEHDMEMLGCIEYKAARFWPRKE